MPIRSPWLYPRLVPVGDGDPAAQVFVTAIKPLRDGNRTMLAARAADGDVQLHLARLQVAEDEEIQKILDGTKKWIRDKIKSFFTTILNPITKLAGGIIKAPIAAL